MISWTLNILQLIDTQVSRFAPVAKVSHKMGTAPQTVYCRHMNKTPLDSLYTKETALLELQDFLFDTMMPADLAVDWFCDRFECSATDEVIDFVVDTHFAMFADQ